MYNYWKSLNSIFLPDISVMFCFVQCTFETSIDQGILLLPALYIFDLVLVYIELSCVLYRKWVIFGGVLQQINCHTIQCAQMLEQILKIVSGLCRHV